MSERERPAWMRPVQYNDDRFEARPSAPPGTGGAGREVGDNGEVKAGSDVEELLRRPDRPTRSDYECNDTTPVDYSKGPHDDELDVSDKDFEASAENPPVKYDQGPHEEEFGVDDDFEPLDDTPEFPED